MRVRARVVAVIVTQRSQGLREEQQILIDNNEDTGKAEDRGGEARLGGVEGGVGVRAAHLPCPVPACRGRSRPAEAGSDPHCEAESVRSRTERSLRGEEEGGGVRIRPGAAKTILLFHIIRSSPKAF